VCRLPWLSEEKRNGIGGGGGRFLYFPLLEITRRLRKESRSSILRGEPEEREGPAAGGGKNIVRSSRRAILPGCYHAAEGGIRKKSSIFAAGDSSHQFVGEEKRKEEISSLASGKPKSLVLSSSSLRGGTENRKGRRMRREENKPDFSLIAIPRKKGKRDGKIETRARAQGSRRGGERAFRFLRELGTIVCCACPLGATPVGRRKKRGRTPPCSSFEEEGA